MDAGKIILSVFIAVLILLAMICVHEFGHFIAGRLLKFNINEFSIGFGPAIFKHKGKKHGTVFSVRCFPLGGYCAFDGEDEEAGEGFNSQKPWKRIVVLISGALMNYLLALAFVMIGYAAFGQACYRLNSVPNGEGYSLEYVLQDGDVILGIGNNNVYFATDLITALQGMKKGDKPTVKVLREGEIEEVTVALREDCDFANSTQIGGVWRALGVGTREGADGKLYWDVGSQNVRFSFWQSAGRSFAYTYRTAGAIFRVLGELLTGRLPIKTMGGPVTTIKLTSEVVAQGVQSFLQVAAYIGVNLAVFNLLPIPALDGSKVIFCIVEWAVKKPVPRKVEAAIHAAGLIFIFAFAVLVDILQFARC